MSHLGRLTRQGHVSTIVKNVLGEPALMQIGRIRMLRPEPGQQEEVSSLSMSAHVVDGTPRNPLLYCVTTQIQGQTRSFMLSNVGEAVQTRHLVSYPFFDHRGITQGSLDHSILFAATSGLEARLLILHLDEP